jgi:ABC-type uncharacterized transport system permease subunit
MTLFADAYDVGRRTARVVPSFVILAVLSVSVAYFCFQIPPEQLAVVALIPPMAVVYRESSTHISSTANG